MAEPSTAPILVHLHIPKNAGTTLSRMLKLRLLTRPATNLLRARDVLGHDAVPDWRRRAEAISRRPEHARARVAFFEAHCAFGVHERLPRACQYLTFLREPCDRVLSVYDHTRATGELAEEVSLERFLSREPADRVWWVDNAQVRYLAGEGGEIVDAPLGGVTREMLDTAKRRLENEISVFGITERFDESLILLRGALGWPRSYYVRSNVTGSRQRLADIGLRLADRIRDLNRLDTELMEFATPLFEGRLAAACADPAAEVARFRRGNARYARLVGPWFAALPAVRRMRRRLRGRGA